MHRESDFFANMAVDAMNMVKEVNPETGKTVYPVKSVGIIKQHGGSAKDSALFNGAHAVSSTPCRGGTRSAIRAIPLRQRAL